MDLPRHFDDDGPAVAEGHDDVYVERVLGAVSTGVREAERGRTGAADQERDLRQEVVRQAGGCVDHRREIGPEDPEIEPARGRVAQIDHGTGPGVRGSARARRLIWWSTRQRGAARRS